MMRVIIEDYKIPVRNAAISCIRAENNTQVSITFKAFHLLNALKQDGVLPALTNIIVRQFMNKMADEGIKKVNINNFREYIAAIKEDYEHNTDGGAYREIHELAFKLWKQNKCSPIQPDMLDAKKKMVAAWRRRTLNYIELPSQSDWNKWHETGIRMGDLVPYELAKRNNLILVSDNFISDLLEESYKITDEMRNNVISTYELLAILEKRGDIGSEFKNKYKGGRKSREENELIDTFVDYDGKLPILVDENFLREIFEMDGVSVISQKCKIYVISNIFDSFENEMEQVELGKDSFTFLEDLKNDIQEYKESGHIGYYGFYVDENKRNMGIFTNDFLDLFHYTSSNSHVIICDDRWVSSYNNFGDCLIYSVVDIVELLHEQKVISDILSYLNL